MDNGEALERFDNSSKLDSKSQKLIDIYKELKVSQCSRPEKKNTTIKMQYIVEKRFCLSRSCHLGEDARWQKAPPQ